MLHCSYMYVFVLTYTRRGSRLCYRLIMYYLCATFFFISPLMHGGSELAPLSPLFSYLHALYAMM